MTLNRSSRLFVLMATLFCLALQTAAQQKNNSILTTPKISFTMQVFHVPGDFLPLHHGLEVGKNKHSIALSAGIISHYVGQKHPERKANSVALQYRYFPNGQHRYFNPFIQGFFANYRITETTNEHYFNSIQNTEIQDNRHFLFMVGLGFQQRLGHHLSLHFCVSAGTMLEYFSYKKETIVPYYSYTERNTHHLPAWPEVLQGKNSMWQINLNWQFAK